MGRRRLQEMRDATLQKVRSGALSAADAYQSDTSGAFSRGMFEPVEAEAKAAKAGQWGSSGTSTPMKLMGVENDPTKMQSAFASQRNPFTSGYAAQRQMGLDDQSDKLFAENGRQMGQAFASRGVTASSPLAQAGQQRNDLARVQARQQNYNTAQTDWVDKGAAWDQTQAGQLDNYGLARSGLNLSYNRQPYELAALGAQTQGQQLSNTYLDKTMGDRVAQAGLQTTGMGINNQAGQLANDYNNGVNYEQSNTRADRQALVREQANAVQLSNQAQGVSLENAKRELEVLRQTDPIRLQREQAEVTSILAQIENLKGQAARADAAQAVEIGKAAGQLAARLGAFKWLGGLAGGAIGSIVPGAGTAVGATGGVFLGDALDKWMGGA